MRKHSNHKQPSGARRVATVAVVFIVAAGATSGTALARHGPSEIEQDPRAHVVIGTGPHAVYLGPAPTVGGEPARGEAEESYHARTGRHLPRLSTATLVEGPWWYGRAPVFGGDPASGETEDSYHARTGRHIGG